jgi:uncharacterized membrane protein
MDEEILIALLVIILMIVPLGLIVAAFVLSVMAWLGVRSARKELDRLGLAVRALSEKPAGEAPAQKVVETVRIPQTVAAPVPEARPAAVVPPAPAPAPQPPPVAPVPSPPAQPARAQDGEKWQRFEERVGKRWMVWVGVLVLFLAAGFFVKYAIDNRWLGPTGRVVLGIIAGIAMLVGGDVSVRRAMRAFGQGLMGGGLAILYVSLFGAFGLYDLIPQAAAFASMIVITIAGMTLAVLHNAIAVSILALLGGILTPVMCSTGVDARDALFGYLVLLDLGVLGVMFFRQWKALDILAFLGTTGLYTGWTIEYYDASALLPAMLWLGAFFLIFLVAPFAYHLRRRSRIDLDRFILGLANATAAFVFSTIMLREKHLHVLGFIALGMSAFYIVLGWTTRRRLMEDGRSLFGFVSLAVIFLTLAVPLHLRLSGITLAWAVEGPILLYLGYTYRYLPARIGGMIVILCAVVRLIVYHMPLHEDLFDPVLNVRFGSALFVPLAAAVFAYIHHRMREGAVLADRILKHAAAILAGLLLLLVVQEELRLALAFGGHGYASWAVVAGLWAIASAGFLAAGTRLGAISARITGAALALGAAATAAVGYMDDTGTDWLYLNPQFVAGLAAAAAFFLYGWVLRRREPAFARGERILGTVLAAVGLFVLFVVLTLETYTYAIEASDDWRKGEWMAMMSVSIVWAVYAATLLVAGFWRNVRALRFTALGLFFLTAVKVVSLDMASVRQIYRIVSFLALGLLMTGASFLYHRVEKSIRRTTGERT